MSTIIATDRPVITPSKKDINNTVIILIIAIVVIIIITVFVIMKQRKNIINLRKGLLEVK